MAAQYELLSQLLKSGGRLDMGQELFYKFYQAFVLKDRWLQYIGLSLIHISEPTRPY